MNAGAKVKPRCERCGEAYERVQSHQRFCRPECRRAWHNSTSRDARAQLLLLTEPERRAIIRGVYESLYDDGGRLKIRFGRYHPEK